MMKERQINDLPFRICRIAFGSDDLSEVPLRQALEGFAVPRFVAGHFIAGLSARRGLYYSENNSQGSGL